MTIYKPCPGCKTTLIAAPARVCADCARAYDQARGSAAARGYGRAWRRRRLAVLREQPMCTEPGCTLPALDVDHRLAKSKGGSEDRNNLSPVCHQHHSAKTVKHDGGFGRAKS